MQGDRISVIIPALDEAEFIADALASAKRGKNIEVIVVDGGSADGTGDVALSHGARVLTSPPGRARQMNAGAEAASGEILLFLHADSRLPRGFDDHVRRLLAVPDTATGAFRLRIDSGAAALQLVERLINLRSRCFGLPYGDQGIFISANIFRALGGFPDIPAMEDFEFMRRARRRGRIAIAPGSVVTSARRWIRQGVLRTTLLNQFSIAAYFFGVSTARIAEWRR